MASNVQITIGADASQLRAQLAVAQSEVRSWSRELSSAANVARRAGDELSLAKVGQAAAGFETATATVAGLKAQMEAAARAARDLNEAMTAPARRTMSGLGEIWGGVLSASGDAARASRAADIAAYGTELDRLRAKYNPLFAAQQQYRSSLADLRNAYKVGAISTTEYESALSKVKDGFAQQVVAIRNAGTENEKLGKGFKLNAQGMMELKAAGVNSFQAWASGMDVVRVAEMEGAQVIGALVQGGVGGMGLLAAAALAVAGAVGYIALQSYRVKETLGGIGAELLLTGRGGGGLADLDKMAEELAKKFDLSKAAAAELLAEIAKARTLGPDMIRMVAELAAAEGAVRRGGGESVTDVDIAKKLAAALNDGAAGAIKLADAFNVDTKAAKELLKAGLELEARDKAVKDLAEHIRSHGGAWAEAKARANEYQRAIAGIAAITSQFGAPDLSQTFPPPPWPSQKPIGGAGTIEPGAERMRQWLRDHGYSPAAAAGIMGNASVESSFNPAARNATGHFGLFQWDKNRQAPLGGSTDFEKQMELMDRELSQLDPLFKNAAGSAGELAQRFERVFERSGGQLMGDRTRRAEGFAGGAGGGGGENQFAAQAAQERETRLMEAEFDRRRIAHRHSLEAQLKDAENHYAEILKYNKEGSAEEIRAKTDVEEKKAALSDQGLQRQVAAFQEAMAKEVTAAGKLPYQQKTIDALVAGGAAITQIDSARTQLAALQRQASSEGLHLQLQGLRAQQAAATETPDKIGIQKQYIGALEGRGAGIVSPMEIAQAKTELAGLERQLRQESVQTLEERLSRQRQMGQLELQQFTSVEQLKVTLGQKTSAQALASEAAAADAMLADQRKRAVGLLDAAQAEGLAARQTEKYADAIKQIDIERATRGAQFLKQEAEAAKAIVDKWVAPVRQAFEQIGSSIESSISGLLTGKKTWGQAVKDVGDSAISSMVSGAGGVLSKLAARGLGAQNGEGLGEALFNNIAKSLNLGDMLGLGGQTAVTATAMSEMSIATTGAMTEMAAVTSAAMAEMAAAVTAGQAVQSSAAVADAVIPFSKGGIVPAAAGGMIVPAAAGGWHLPAKFGPDRTLAALTPGETVLPLGEKPSYLANAMRGMIGDAMAAQQGGGPSGAPLHVHFNGPADGPSVDRWFKGMMARNPDGVRRVFRSNALTPRTI